MRYVLAFTALAGSGGFLLAIALVAAARLVAAAG
jgi:hypothetical protein